MPRPLIYLFEDDPSLQGLLIELLTEELGAEVRLCATVAEIRRRGEEQRPDAIVADFWGTSHLALSDGDRAEITAIGGVAPLVLVSARRWVEDAQPEELGIAGLIRKPLEIDAFLAVLKDTLSPRDEATELPPREVLSVFFYTGPSA